LLAGYDWYPPLADIPPERGLEVYSGRFFDRDKATMATILQASWTMPADAPRDFVNAHLNRPGADTALDRVLRLDSQVMLVDDPVKRVDNMTMGSGPEGRTPALGRRARE